MPKPTQDWREFAQQYAAEHPEDVTGVGELPRCRDLQNLEVGHTQSEAEFQKEVINYLHERGWRVAHFRKVRVQRKGGKTYWETPVAADGKGFLDLECVRERLVKIELKVGKNTTTEDQAKWCDAYAKAGVEWYVFSPADWPTIREVMV